jgi:hypothetical protein
MSCTFQNALGFIMRHQVSDQKSFNNFDLAKKFIIDHDIDGDQETAKTLELLQHFDLLDNIVFAKLFVFKIMCYFS